MLKPLFVFLGMLFFCLFIVWYSGVDLLVRSSDNAFGLAVTVAVSALTSVCVRQLDKS